MITNEELLRKATLTTSDFGGAGEAPLTVQQVREFIQLLQADQDMLPDVRTVTSGASKWEESKLDFSSRIAKPGSELTRLDAADRVKPSTGIVEISTVLIRGEVPVSDEVMEDNVEEDGFANTLETMIADRFGYDIEELMLNGDTTNVGDAYLALLDGWLVQAQGSGGNVYDASADGQDYQSIFKTLLVSLSDRYKRGLERDGRFYVPKRLEEMYRDVLASRGTPLGDLTLTGNNELRYQGILIKGVSNMAVTAGTPDTSYILLSHRMNLYAGYRRRLTMETYRDPREGGTSFVVTARVDAQVAHVPATAIATSVDVEP